MAKKIWFYGKMNLMLVLSLKRNKQNRIILLRNVISGIFKQFVNFLAGRNLTGSLRRQLLEIACAPAIKVRRFGIITQIAIAGPLESA